MILLQMQPNILQIKTGRSQILAGANKNMGKGSPHLPVSKIRPCCGQKFCKAVDVGHTSRMVFCVMACQRFFFCGCILLKHRFPLSLRINILSRLLFIFAGFCD